MNYKTNSFIHNNDNYDLTNYIYKNIYFSSDETIIVNNETINGFSGINIPTLIKSVQYLPVGVYLIGTKKLKNSIEEKNIQPINNDSFLITDTNNKLISDSGLSFYYLTN